MEGCRQAAILNAYETVTGIDEVGRGPLAGPVVAAAVTFSKDTTIEGLNDSKKLTAKKRKALEELIYKEAVSVSVSFIFESEIDELNIYQAAKKAMLEAVSELEQAPFYILADAMDLKEAGVPCESIIKGDQKEPCIMAASIVAKEARDRFMIKLGEKHPQYGFEKHMGYGTALHMSALKEFGVLPYHRRSFKPVMKTILREPALLSAEIGGLSPALIVEFMSRVKKMGLSEELQENVSIINKALSGRLV
jgi:ribonuclease HII